MLTSKHLHEYYNTNGYDKNKEIFRFLGEDGQEEDSLDFQQLDHDATLIAAHLTIDQKLSPGDVVLLMYPPGLDFMRSMLGCIYGGFLAVPLSPPPPSQLEQVRNFCYSSLIV